MIEQNLLTQRITVNPEVMMGKPTIRGLRVTVEQLLQALAAGVPMQDLLDDYPELETADFQAIFHYAAELVSETKVYPVAV
jgi:uncharacterized protein (DUF433 family)